MGIIQKFKCVRYVNSDRNNAISYLLHEYQHLTVEYHVQRFHDILFALSELSYQLK